MSSCDSVFEFIFPDSQRQDGHLSTLPSDIQLPPASQAHKLPEGEALLLSLTTLWGQRRTVLMAGIREIFIERMNK